MHLDLIATVQAPVTSDGQYIKDRQGVVIAMVMNNNTFLASALAALVNAGIPTAQKANDAYEAKERLIGGWLKAGR